MGNKESTGSLADTLADVKQQVADQKRTDAEAAQQAAHEEALQEQERAARARDLQAEYNVTYTEIAQSLQAFEISQKDMQRLLAGEELSDELKAQLDAAVDNDQEKIFALQQKIIDLTRQMEEVNALPEQVQEFEAEVEKIREKKQEEAERKEQHMADITKRRSRMEEIDTLIDAHLQAYAAVVEEHGRRGWGTRKDSEIPSYDDELRTLRAADRELNTLASKIEFSLKNLGWFSGRKKNRLEALKTQLEEKKAAVAARIQRVEKAQQTYKDTYDEAFPLEVQDLLNERYELRRQEENDYVPKEYLETGVPRKPPSRRERHPWSVDGSSDARKYVRDRFRDETTDIPDDSSILPYKEIDITNLQASIDAAV